MTQSTRPSIEQVMMAVASTMALRSTCPRLNVGAVIAKDGRIVSTGYNGAPAGMPHCPPKDQHTQPCTDAIHAETNAIVYAARAGISTNGATLYCTHAPCAPCARLVASAGITKMVYGDTYRSEQGLAELKFLGIQIAYLPKEHQLP